MITENFTEADIIKYKEQICFEKLLSERKLSQLTLEKLIGYVNLRQVLMTQTLTLDFICKYILDNKYYQEDNERTIHLGLVTTHQPYTYKQIKEYMGI